MNDVEDHESNTSSVFREWKEYNSTPLLHGLRKTNVALPFAAPLLINK